MTAKGWFEIDQIKRTSSYTMPINHFHDHYELYYLMTGERYYFIQHTTHHIREGDLVFVNKRLLHKTINAVPSEHERLLISFDDAFIDSPDLLDVFLTGSPILRPGESEAPLVVDLLHALLREAGEQDLHYKHAARHILSQLLIVCARLKQASGTAPNPADSQPSPLHPIMTDIVRYMNDHYAERITLSSTASQFDLSPSYLSRTFKRTTGFSFVEFLNNIRVMEAQRLLTETDRQVIVIAGDVGFQNIAHFGRVFKQISHCAPRAYRRRPNRRS